MPDILTRLKIIFLYLSLSPGGKDFLKRTTARRARLDKEFGKPDQEPRKVFQLLRMLRVCDREFCRQATVEVCRRLSRERKAMYERFVPYAWFSLLIWSKMLDAFGIKHDSGSLSRCALIAFTHREWNDLFDNRGYTFNQLYAAFDPQEAIPPELEFLRQLKQMETKLADPRVFTGYYRHMREFRVCSLFEYTPDKAQVILDEVAPFVAMLFIYAMRPEVPVALKETVKPVARWLYMLDELTDLEQDRLLNRITYMMLVKDPQEAMKLQLEECRRLIDLRAPFPQELLKFMEMITGRIIQASRQGGDIDLRQSLGF